MITVKNMTKSYDATVIRDVSFQAQAGEFIAILGGSGSGKTTLLRLLALKEKWDDGQYIYKGKNILKANVFQKFQLKQHWDFLPEQPSLHEQKTAVKNVVGAMVFRVPLWRRLIGKPTLDQHVQASDYLEKVGLLERAQLKTEKLSGGEKQRVALARAMVKDADVIFTDEPVTGLDPRSAERVMSDLRSVCEQEGLLIFCCLHNVSLAEKFATRIWGLADSNLVLDTPQRRLTMQEKRLLQLQ